VSTTAGSSRTGLAAGAVGPLAGRLRRRIREGDLGPLPVVLALVAIAVIFQSQNSNFLSALNLTNLMVQIAAVGTISVGVVLILLLGEIDLSVGAVSGLCAGVTAVLSVRTGMPGPLAVAVGVLCGTAIGLIQGWWTTRLRVASFIVTLAGQLGWAGALLYLLGSTGTLNLDDGFITGLANQLVPVWLGWILGIGFIGASASSVVLLRRRRRAAGLAVAPPWALLLRLAILGGGTVAAITVMSIDRSRSVIPVRGVPAGVVLFLGFVVLLDVITQRTRYGRHIYAVGGSAEAARRAGIDVDRVRITVFMLASTLAACGGILAASRLYAVNQSSGGGDVLLDSIAAAVIGGTSLFGGRGRVWSALLGALVIGSIANGMDLLAFPSSVKFMITGGVLLVAVTIDAVSRRGRLASGRA
jgi:D-xylose transport system permease protein